VALPRRRSHQRSAGRVLLAARVLLDPRRGLCCARRLGGSVLGAARGLPMAPLPALFVGDPWWGLPGRRAAHDPGRPGRARGRPCLLRARRPLEPDESRAGPPLLRLGLGPVGLVPLRRARILASRRPPIAAGARGCETRRASRSRSRVGRSARDDGTAPGAVLG
jgi:hypothetical protein